MRGWARAETDDTPTGDSVIGHPRSIGVSSGSFSAAHLSGFSTDPAPDPLTPAPSRVANGCRPPRRRVSLLPGGLPACSAKTHDPAPPEISAESAQFVVPGRGPTCRPGIANSANRRVRVISYGRATFARNRAGEALPPPSTSQGDFCRAKPQRRSVTNLDFCARARQKTGRRCGRRGPDSHRGPRPGGGAPT